MVKIKDIMLSRYGIPSGGSNSGVRYDPYNQVMTAKPLEVLAECPLGLQDAVCETKTSALKFKVTVITYDNGEKVTEIRTEEKQIKMTFLFLVYFNAPLDNPEIRLMSCELS